MTVEDCKNCGNAGDGKTYRGANLIDDDITRYLQMGAAPYFGWVKPDIRLPAFPNAQATAQELAELRALKLVRAQYQKDIDDEKDGFDDTFYAALGIRNSTKRSTEKLMMKIHGYVKYFVAVEKHRFDRPRPVQLDPSLAPPFCPCHESYPSGHSTESHACAAMLIAATPSQPRYHANVELAAENITRRREIAGVHYKSDSEAGAVLAGQLMAALAGDGAYSGLLSKVQAELEILLDGKQPPVFEQRVHLHAIKA
jgi:hypothetical protein